MLLYAPLIGQQACLLYVLLLSLALQRQSLSWKELGWFMRQSDAPLKKSLERLEQFLLVRTFRSDKQEYALLLCQPPMDYEGFMRHELFGRLLVDTVGEEQLAAIRTRLHAPLNLEGLQETTSLFNPDLLEANWNERKEETFAFYAPDRYDISQIDFDWDLFYKGCKRTIPERLRTPKNEQEIAFLANVLGVDEVEMRRKVIRNVNQEKTQILFDQLVEHLLPSNQIKTLDPNDYTQSPVGFLRARQPENAFVQPKEKKMLLELEQKHQFVNEVINTILEYAMAQSDGSLSITYVRTLANNMARAGVTTREQALEFLDKPKKAKAGSTGFKTTAPALPDWYAEIPTEQASAQEIEAVLELQRKLFGGNDDGTH